MTSDESGGSPARRKSWIDAWRGAGNFLRSVLLLQHSVELLKGQVNDLNQRVSSLQRQLDEQAGHLKVLVGS